MKTYYLAVLALLCITPVYAQEPKNPSLVSNEVEVPWSEFNIVARDASKMSLNEIHEISWQVTIENDLVYANPNGNGVLRLYDHESPEKFLEIGMGAPPDEKFWVALNLPDEGYVVVNSKAERGWVPSSRIIASFTNQAGLSVNNGERIVVSNLDIGNFAIDSYSVYGMESSSDPPAVNSGMMTVEFLSGDPSKNVLHLFPFYITIVVGAIAGILYLTKKR
ncbi:MAG: hypothetical protein GWN01_13635 [Nitrosopumilaceae archaeon]|nr:hypothetical protein [Nitrosopumilaceae archaeon]NIU01906.1 hypothetical protein [Nitrosopumilaceae archaeon]NIU88310.1 hypothetical protein [Nitrosopumilaceae archaeon]NIV66602.1 hypothetical protein [Nitrosopumilaceae archaeon]NIX62507.1 hypothetical protein [Nitrosopumilaceae archaeon]